MPLVSLVAHYAPTRCCHAALLSCAGTTPNAVQPEGRINVRFRRLEPEEDRSLATCNIVVMEFCDKGSLRHAMKRGVFHKRLGSTSVAVDLCAIVQVGTRAGRAGRCSWLDGQGWGDVHVWVCLLQAWCWFVVNHPALCILQMVCYCLDWPWRCSLAVLGAR